ncbi:hypothetical protein MHU86_24021 [Fragilaria crotonensis]|nr:hypothetical protein MHU86_24021 [Fragilaria crotonensis]
MAVDFYTIPQQITLVITSLISGLVSLLGSLTIIYIIWRDRHEKLKCVYHRILFALSICDCIASLNFAFGFLLVPVGNFWGAQGNTASCAASGFLNTFFASQILYNFGLALYYLLIVRYGKTQKFVSRNIEPYTHFLALSIPMAVNFWALLTSALNPLPFLGGWCSFTKYPPLCDAAAGECTRGFSERTISFVMFVGMLFPSFIGIAIIMFMIICHVRGRIAAVVRYRTRPRLDQTARQTVAQALLYIAASLFPNALLLVNHSFNHVFPTQQETARFVLSFLVKLIVPLQGLFNLIIYVRPRYIALRRNRGDRYSFCSLISEIVIGVKSRPVESNDDQRADDFAPELAVPGSDNSDTRSDSSSGGVDEDDLPSSQDLENVHPDAEDCNLVDVEITQDTVT